MNAVDFGRAGMGGGLVRERFRHCRGMPEAAGVHAGARRVPGSPWVLPRPEPGSRLRSVSAPWFVVRARAGLETRASRLAAFV